MATDPPAASAAAAPRAALVATQTRPTLETAPALQGRGRRPGTPQDPATPPASRRTAASAPRRSTPRQLLLLVQQQTRAGGQDRAGAATTPTRSPRPPCDAFVDLTSRSNTATAGRPRRPPSARILRRGERRLFQRVGDATSVGGQRPRPLASSSPQPRDAGTSPHPLAGLPRRGLDRVRPGRKGSRARTRSRLTGASSHPLPPSLAELTRAKGPCSARTDTKRWPGALTARVSDPPAPARPGDSSEAARAVHTTTPSRSRSHPASLVSFRSEAGTMRPPAGISLEGPPARGDAVKAPRSGPRRRPARGRR